MIDFFGSFVIIIFLAMILFAGCTFFFIAKIFFVFFNKRKREKIEQIIQSIADELVYYKENKNIDQTSEILKNIKTPKYMIIAEEGSELSIKYKNLVYSVNKGRFVVDR